MIRRDLLLNVIPFLFVPLALAGLEWKATSKQVEVHPLQILASLSFGFTNTGDKPVSILNIQPECGCISGIADKTTVQPGESGVVEVRFNLRGRTGPQEKGVSVITDDPDASPTRLTLNTTIPVAYEISPRQRTWQKGEEHTSKSCIMNNVGKIPIRLVNAESPVEGVAVELKTIRVGFEYELVITPAAGHEKVFAPIVIHPEKPPGMDAVKSFTVYAAVW